MRAHGVLAAVMILSPPAATAASLVEWADAFERPAISGAGIVVHDRRLVYGQLELVLDDGWLVPVRACGRVVGAFFAGSGSFRYTVKDPILAATWLTNVKHATAYEVGADGAISDRLHTALVLLSAGADTLVKDSRWMQGEPQADIVATFQQHLERRATDLGGRFGSLLPQAMTDPPLEPVEVTEIGAERHDLVHVRDNLRDDDESLACMRKRESDLDVVRDPDFLCIQPIARQRLQSRPRRFRLVGLDVTLVNPDGERAEVEVREILEIDVPLRALEFWLDNRMIAETSEAGKPAVKLYEIASLANVEGNQLPFLHRHGELVVELPQRMPAGSRIEVGFQLAGDVLLRPGSVSCWELMDSWYPNPQRKNLEAFTYHATCKVRKPFVAFSCGRTERRWEEGEYACAEFRESRPIQYAFVRAGRYSTYTVERESLTVRVSTYVARDEDRMRQIAGLALGLIQFYVPLMGEYPFHELNIVEVNDFGWGIGPAGVVLISREAFARVQLEEVAGLYVQGINRRLAHEVAHAWWGHVAKLGELEDQWLSESIAEYYSAFALGRMKGEDEFDAAFRDWKSLAKDSADRGTIYLANQLCGEDASKHRYNLLYGKGPLMLHALRHAVGDNTFFTILKSYLRSFSFKPATTRDFIGITNFITKQDHAAFFDRYLFGVGKIDVDE